MLNDIADVFSGVVTFFSSLFTVGEINRSRNESQISKGGGTGVGNPVRRTLKRGGGGTGRGGKSRQGRRTVKATH